MKKAFVSTILCVFVLLSATSCGRILGRNSRDIGREEAALAAFSDAGIEESDTTSLRISRDTDDGQKIYEVKFATNEAAYDYDILAADGSILSSEREQLKTPADNNTAPAGDSAQADTPAQTPSSSSGQETENPDKISLEEARSLALERVPGASETDIQIESDYDHGIHKYEGDIHYNRKEYDFEIDAATGKFLEWTEEYD